MRIAVYKACFGIELSAPFAEPEPGVTQLLFSDRKLATPHAQTVYVPPRAGSGKDQNRRLKILMDHPLLRQFDCSVYLDDNVRLRTTRLVELVPHWIADHGYAVLRHSQRDCIFAEARAVIARRKAPPLAVARQVRRLLRSGMPTRAGLTECCVLIRDHRRPLVHDLNERWWEDYRRGCGRDQLSFDLVRWQSGAELTCLEGTIAENPWFERIVPVGGYRCLTLTRAEERERRILLSRPGWRWLTRPSLRRQLWSWLQRD